MARAAQVAAGMLAVMLYVGPARGDLHPPAKVLREAFALAPDTILVRFAEPPGDRVFVAHEVDASAADTRAFLLDPENIRRAVPAFVRATTATTRTRNGADAPDRAVDWELEIPLWNLGGRLWSKAFPATVQLRFTEGAFAPGMLLLRTIPVREGKCILTIDGRLNAAGANFATRMVAGRHPLAGVAMTAAALVTMARALALTANAKGIPETRWPTQAITDAALAHIEVGAINKVAEALGDDAPLGLVRVTSGGRLALAQIAWRPPGRSTPAGPALGDALFDARQWTALPGWHHIAASSVSRSRHGAAVHWSVTGEFPFVDFDATWLVQRGRSLRGIATSGAQKGAVWAWHPCPKGVPGTFSDRCLPIYSSHPRLDRTGTLPQRFIASEPLLEHGMSLALAYVNAVTLLQRIAREPRAR